mgnify:CR=1 FL=1
MRVLRLLIFMIYLFSNKFLKKPINFIKKYSDITFLTLDYRFLVSKSFDILFQQILIISLVMMLNQEGLSTLAISLIFAVMFGFGHVPILKIHKGLFGYFYLVASLISSFLFPYLIINYTYGFIYTYIAHWMFYTNSGIFFWIIKKDETIADNLNINKEKLEEIKTTQISPKIMEEIIKPEFKKQEEN